MKHVLFKTMGITTLLITLIVLMVAPAVFAADIEANDSNAVNSIWQDYSGFLTSTPRSGTVVANDANSDGLTWQISTQVIGYYDILGQYYATVHDAWRGAISPAAYNGNMYYEFAAWGPGGTYSTGTLLSTGIHEGPRTIYPYYANSAYLTGAYSWDCAYFVINNIVQYKESYAAI